jgi:hypothetical protein
MKALPCKDANCLPSGAQIRAGHDVQLRLRLPGETREEHGNTIAQMLVAGAIDHHAGAMQFAPARRQQRHRHFSPGSEGSRAAKFDAAFVHRYPVGAQFELCLPRCQCHRLKRTNASSFSCAHSNHTNIIWPAVKFLPFNYRRAPRQARAENNQQNQVPAR